MNRSAHAVRLFLFAWAMVLLSLPNAAFAASGGPLCSWLGWLVTPLGLCTTSDLPPAPNRVVEGISDTRPPSLQSSEVTATSSVVYQTVNNEYVTVLGAGATDADLNARFSGLLAHVRWLLERPTTAFGGDELVSGSHSATVARLERQLFAFMDESADDDRDVRDELSNLTVDVDVDGEITTALLASPSLFGATFTGTTTMADGLALGTTTLQDLLTVDGAIYLAEANPLTTSNRLYNFGGDLYWNGSIVTSSSTGNWSVSGGDVFRLTGNVGIGTSSPQYTLHVDGTMGITENLAVNGTNRITTSGWFQAAAGSAAAPSYITNSDSETGMYFPATHELGFVTAQTERLRIDATGNVGIGTTTPNRLLTVTGDALFTGTTTAPLIDAGGTVCDVRAYGAVGDDSTINDAAIAAAIADCPEGGTVYFPLGEFRISQPIVLDRPVTLRGAYSPRWSYSSTPRSSIRADFASFAGVAMIHVRDHTISGEVNHNNGGRLEYLMLDGGSAGADVDGIYFEGLVRDWKLTDVDISQVTGNGFEAAVGTGSGNPRGFTIRGLSIYSADGHGFRATALNDSYIEDLLAVGNALRGIYLSSMGETKVNNSRAVFNALEGLYIDGASNNGGLMFTDFSTDRNDRHGVRVSLTGTTTVTFNGLLTRRDGANVGGGTETPYAGVAIIGTTTEPVAPVFINGLSQIVGLDDSSNPPLAPLVGVRVTNASYVKVDGQLWGVDDAYIDGGGNDYFLIADNSIIKTGNSGVSEAAPPLYQRSWVVATSSRQLTYDGVVNIGSSTSNRLLNIVAPSNAGARFLDTTNNVTFDMRAEDFQAFFGTFSNHQLRFQTNNLSRLTIDTDGDVGIGTTTPTSKLTLAQSADYNGFEIYGYDDQSLSSANFSIGSSGELVIQAGAGGGALQGYGGTYTMNWGDNRISVLDNIEYSFGTDLDYSFGYNAADDTLRLVDGYDVSSSTLARMTVNSAGNIGIGTTTPSSKLTLAQSADSNGIAVYGYDDQANTGLRLYVDSLGYSLLNTEGSLGTGVLAANGTAVAAWNASNMVVLDNKELVFGIDLDYAFGYNAADDTLRLVDGDDVSSSTLTRLTVTSAGNIGIGTTTPSAQLTVNSTVRFAGITGGDLTTDALGNVTVSSDERLKDVLSVYEAGLDEVLGLEPIRYRWNEESGYDQESIYAGFSAQNVEAFLPEAVGEDGRGYKTLSTRPILAAVVNAVQELYAMVTGNTERIAELEERIAELEAVAGVGASAEESAAERNGADDTDHANGSDEPTLAHDEDNEVSAANETVADDAESDAGDDVVEAGSEDSAEGSMVPTEPTEPSLNEAVVTEADDETSADDEEEPEPAPNTETSESNETENGTDSLTE